MPGLFPSLYIRVQELPWHFGLNIAVKPLRRVDHNVDSVWGQVMRYAQRVLYLCCCPFHLRLQCIPFQQSLRLIEKYFSIPTTRRIKVPNILLSSVIVFPCRRSM